MSSKGKNEMGYFKTCIIIIIIISSKKTFFFFSTNICACFSFLHFIKPKHFYTAHPNTSRRGFIKSQIHCWLSLNTSPGVAWLNVPSVALSMADSKVLCFWRSILDSVPLPQQRETSSATELSIFIERLMFMRQGTRVGPGDISIWDRASISYGKYSWRNESVGRKST